MKTLIDIACSVIRREFEKGERDFYRLKAIANGEVKRAGLIWFSDDEFLSALELAGFLI